jgi:hypothetical protein
LFAFHPVLNIIQNKHAMNRFPAIILLSVMLISLSFGMISDDCKSYYPTKVGETRTYTNYDKNGKITATNTQKVLAVNNIEGGIEISMGVEMKTTDSDSIISSKFTAKCQHGVYSVSMDQFFDEKVLAPYQGMEIAIESENLEMPVKPVTGQKLKDGYVTVKILSNSIVVVTINVTVSNRQVAAVEDLTTPAGTFSCAKITYDVESKFGFIKSKSQAAEWYSRNVGLVKSETYDKKGKLESYSMITAMSK